MGPSPLASKIYQKFLAGGPHLARFLIHNKINQLHHNHTERTEQQAHSTITSSRTLTIIKKEQNNKEIEDNHQVKL